MTPPSPRRSSRRPTGEVIDPAALRVEVIPDDTTARAFVSANHYSGTYPAARRRFGLMGAEGDLLGVAVFSVPANNKVITNVFDAAPTDALELGRFVLLDRVAANGESWFLARCLRAVKREGFAGVVSFSDPHPRTTLSGDVVFKGHLGTIYQATNARYLGRSTTRTLHMLPDGAVFSARSAQKIRTRARGHAAAARSLEAYGAAPLLPEEDSRVWLRRWLDVLARRVRHRGNHRYAWGFARRGGWAPGAVAAPYPKPMALDPDAVPRVATPVAS